MESCTRQADMMQVIFRGDSNLRGAKLILVPQNHLQDSHDGRTSSTDENSFTSPQNPAIKSQRTRRTHNKVRTGCLTCKIRRKKCDEMKPACDRCTKTGRTCDGYPGADRTTSNQRVSTASSNSITKSLPVPAIFAHSEIPTPHLSKSLVSDSDVDKVDSQVQLPCGLPSSSASDKVATPGSTMDIDETEIDQFIITYPISPKRPKLNTATLKPSILPRSPNSFTDFGIQGSISSLEAHCFSLFRHRTGPQFAAYFDSNLWCSYSPQLALSHPCLFAAATALGAVHRRFQLGITPEAFEYCAHVNRLHRRAVAMLATLKTHSIDTGTCYAMSASTRDVIMSSEFLLGLFEGFQANYPNAVTHINNGIASLLDRPMILLHSESTHMSTFTLSDPSVLAIFFARIHERSIELFGTPHRILSTFGSGQTLPSMPIIFNTLEEARDLIFTEVDWIMRTPPRVWRLPERRTVAQKLHVSRLLKWSVAYANTSEKMDKTEREKRACMLLKLCKNAAYLLLYMTLYVYVDEELAGRRTERRGVEGLCQAAWQIGIDDDEEILDLRFPSNDLEDGRSAEQEHNTNYWDGRPHEKGLAYANEAFWTAISRREELMTNLARVKILGEAILDESSPFNYVEHSLSFDSAIGPPRCSALEPESSGKTRHLVKSLLKRRRVDDDEDWDWLDIYGIAEKISALEEHAVISAVRNKIPPEVDPRWVDITCMMESRRLLLRYCHPGGDGMGMRWIQEWWAF